MSASVLICSSAIVGIAGGAFSLDSESFTVTTTATNAATSVTVTNENVRGLIYEIKLIPETANATGTVTVVADPLVGTFANVQLAAITNLSAETVVRPRLDSTDTLGSALTSDAPEMYALVAERLKMTVVNANKTSATFRVQVKYLKQ